ncbi:MAG: class I SAM-dependent methyltransferase [Gemmataceae bacterium]
MSETQFFELFLQELRENSILRGYYHLLDSSWAFGFRKTYFLQRLAFLARHVPRDPTLRVWDCGCGFGTQGIFLSLNGVSCRGSTLDYFIGHIPPRLAYWARHGDVSRFRFRHENLFDLPIEPAATDIVLAADTLHHLEPIDEALDRIARALRPGGKLLVFEENGNNLLQCLMLYRLRGNQRVVDRWDDGLQKFVRFGHENIRPLWRWERLLARHGLIIDKASVEYIRMFLPPFYLLFSADRLRRWENVLRRLALFRELLFFGVNFAARRRASVP